MGWTPCQICNAGRRQLKRTRRAVASAARSVIERDGRLETWVSDIVTEVGLGRGSSHVYFGSKRKLFHGIVHEVGDHLRLVVARQPGNDTGDAIMNVKTANRGTSLSVGSLPASSPLSRRRSRRYGSVGTLTPTA
ncbi:TetR/AcrR family transcriptional regulator [Mycobacterium sp.]|uniref:TetR/AcrR family transcriptional regulator n=1 Tax=Mycobacterium sp. TaxID=1785 RepID=UPI003BB21018